MLEFAEEAEEGADAKECAKADVLYTPKNAHAEVSEL